MYLHKIISDTKCTGPSNIREELYFLSNKMVGVAQKQNSPMPIVLTIPSAPQTSSKETIKTLTLPGIEPETSGMPA